LIEIYIFLTRQFVLVGRGVGNATGKCLETGIFFIFLMLKNYRFQKDTQMSNKLDRF
jgi:hypothetical protein